MNILGVNAYHGDSSACLVVDGQLVAAVEEERFRRVKHWAGFPSESIKYCLNSTGCAIDQVDHIAFNRDPKANLMKKVLFAFSKRPNMSAVRDRIKNAAKIRDAKSAFADTLKINASRIHAKFHMVEHHHTHMSSAFHVSPFKNAAVVSVDGFGDFVSMMWGIGDRENITVKDQVIFPHSLGLFYLAMTQFLGFPNYGDEYKLMGLAAYGKPKCLNGMRQIVRLISRGRFELDLDFFLHHSEGVSMIWEDGEPKIGKAYSLKLEKLFGVPRKPNEEITQEHKDLAASTQQMYEEAFFHILDHVQRTSKKEKLCLAGGCAMNSVANGKIFKKTKFRDLYVQPAAGDAGGAIGAAFSVWHGKLKKPRSFQMKHAYWGPSFLDEQINERLIAREKELKAEKCEVTNIDDMSKLCEITAKAIADGKVIGWFQGRMEWGPRALGNRSILCDPRRADMKHILNLKIKRRESFRPFAPSILRERVDEWFETDYDVPFMLQVYMIRPEKRDQIPAVCHVDGSGRLQTITEDENPRYYALISRFYKLTRVPMLLNTSFNENEPIVCRPEEALDCFLRTKMDVLVVGNYFICRNESVKKVE